ncbi:type II toxin-antitoxin system VapC family toxin [Candidatus Acetothermia bacterium]|nr:type II toxin-antitoxin system VapC family toxin [Candidatus Acetothermia bacterium]
MAEFFLDVNVPMYAAGKAHLYKAPCTWIMAEIAEGRLAAAIDVEIIQEILYRYGALGRWPIGTSMAKSLLDLVPTIYPIAVADIRLAVQLFERYAPKGVTARDLIHVAVMRHNELHEIISTDAHLDLIPEIKRVDPQRLFAQKHS